MMILQPTTDLLCKNEHKKKIEPNVISAFNYKANKTIVKTQVNSIKPDGNQ